VYRCHCKVINWYHSCKYIDVIVTLVLQAWEEHRSAYVDMQADGVLTIWRAVSPLPQIRECTCIGVGVSGKVGFLYKCAP
jgi:hypothetical protein